MKLLDWIDKHRVLTILTVVWLAWLMSAVTLIGFINPPNMNSAVATVLVAIWGTPALIVGLVKWRNESVTKKGKPDE